VKNKKLLAILLLSMSFCFMSGVGYGEIKYEGIYMVIRLLEARVDYIMHNPNSFLEVRFYNDRDGAFTNSFPKGVDTKGKVYVWVTDNRDQFSYKSEIALLDTFKRSLEVIYSFISLLVTNMNTDVVAKLESKERIPLAYFYQGEYHLWEE